MDSKGPINRHALQLGNDRQYRLLVESIKDFAIYMLDLRGVVVSWNAGAERLTGYSAEEIIGHNFSAFYIPEEQARGEPERTLNTVINEGRFESEGWRVRNNGLRFWASVVVDPIREDGKVVGFAKVTRDITERIETEKYLVKVNAALLQSKKIAAIAEKQTELRVALEEMLNEKTMALEQRDLLLREVYHRVKNNLQIIDSFLVLQYQKLQDVDAKNALKSLRGRVYALGLVHHQLMAAKDFATFDIAPFLIELIQNITDSSASTDIQLSVTAKPMAVGLDFAIPFGLLVTELVTNAVKHAFPLGKGNITVIFNQEEDGNILLVVSDDGRGIIESMIDSAHSNVGLGKSIIAGLVRQLKGTMNMQTDSGTRAEVRIKSQIIS